MKNTFKTLFQKIGLYPILALTVLAVVSVTGCGSKGSASSPRTPALLGISANTDLVKTVYHIGDELDLTGLEVSAFYSDQSTRAVDNYTLDDSAFDSSDTGESTIYIEWNGMFADFTVIIDETIFTGIVIESDPDQILYKTGEDFDLTGIVVMAHYKFNEIPTDPEPLGVNMLQISGFDPHTAGYQEITVSYGGDSASFWVMMHVLKGISAQHNETDYKIGEPFDPDNLTVTAYYSDGIVDTIPYTVDYEELMIEGFDSTEAGPKTITVTWQGMEDTFEVTVDSAVFVGIEITTEPAKKTYKTGEELDLTGIVVMAHYAYLGGEEIEPHPIHISMLEKSELSPFAKGTQNITVSYGGKEASFSIKMNALQSMTVTAPTKTIYKKGEALNLAGYKVTGTYDDSESVTNLTIGGEELTLSAFNPAAVGSQTITVKYNIPGTIADKSFAVTVVDLARIDINTDEVKKEYTKGESFNYDNIIVKAVYTDGKIDVLSEEVAVGPSNFSGFSSAAGGEKTITVTYNGKTATFKVDVLFTVAFNASGGKLDGSGSVASQMVKLNGTATDPGTPDKKYYDFSGWYTDSDVMWNFGAGKVSSDITLSAKWNLLSFNENIEGSDLAEYLQLEGGTIEEPFIVILTRDLGNTAVNNEGWYELLTTIGQAGKYVDLNLSACPMTYGTFNPVYDSDGMRNIVGIVFPNTTTTIQGGKGLGVGESTFKGFTNLKSITGGENLVTINSYAFSECALVSVTMQRVTPVTSLGIAAIDYKTAGLRIEVPTDSVAAYKSAWGTNYSGMIFGF